MTARDFAYACLDYIGEFSLTLTEYTGNASTAVFRALARAGNQALGDLFEANPHLFKGEAGATVRAPETGTITVTNGSTAVAATTLTGAMAGNTISIEGQTEWNAIRTEGAAKKLLFPYTGPTGVHAATMYGDALLLDTRYSKPLGPVWLSDLRELAACTSKGEFIAYDSKQDLHGDWGRNTGIAGFPQAPTVGQPEVYFCEPHVLESGTSEIRIFLKPLPEKLYTLRFDAGVRPLEVTVANFGSDATDPLRNFPIAGGNDAAFLLPVWLYFWSTSTFFKNDTARKQILANYERVLPQIEAWRVQPATGGGIVTRGWK